MPNNIVALQYLLFKKFKFDGVIGLIIYTRNLQKRIQGIQNTSESVKKNNIMIIRV